MERVKVSCRSISGIIKIPSSKSLSHRAIIAASIGEGTSKIGNITYSEDIEATITSLEAFGVSIEKNDDNLFIKGNGDIFELTEDTETPIKVNCGESGSTLRFLIPLAALTGRRVILNRRGRLRERPIDPFLKIFDEQNIYYDNLGESLILEGRLKPGEYKVPGNISSQFITGLLFALPLLEENSKIIITTELESKSYVDLTLDVLKTFSINIVNKNYKEFKINGRQHYKAKDIIVEGDFSQAAFFLAAGVLSEGDKTVTVTGINTNSHQGDMVIVDLIKKMGGRLEVNEDSIKAYPSKLKGITMDASECPDLVPIMAVLGALSEGTTEIVNAGRLRMKESDRLKAIAKELNNIGAKVLEKEDGLHIEGKSNLEGGSVDSWKDHRIAMAMAVASLKAKEPIIISNSQAVNKSYPEYFKDFSTLGGIVEYIN
ncbi:MAG TPA: 3-phosphoshikimate 1-carboxyvinyltransferase [Clostridiaceae bacterium]